MRLGRATVGQPFGTLVAWMGAAHFQMPRRKSFRAGMEPRFISYNVSRMIDRSARTDGAWSRAEFEWDEENDQYICPEGHALRKFRRNYSDPSRGKNVTGTRKYRALRAICQACPSKDLCCPNADARYVTRTPDEDARDFARDCRKTKAYKVSRDKRKKVEMLFAHLKRILTLTRLRLRGPTAPGTSSPSRPSPKTCGSSPSCGRRSVR